MWGGHRPPSFSVRILIKVDDARPVGVARGARGRRVGSVEAGAGALLLVFIPEIAAVPDAMTETGKGADGGGVVYHIFPCPAIRDLCEIRAFPQARSSLEGTARRAPTGKRLILKTYKM